MKHSPFWETRQQLIALLYTRASYKCFVLSKSHKKNAWIFLNIWNVIIVTGKDLLMPVNLTVDIWDGEVTLLWDPPEGAPPLAQYQVQMARYTPYSLRPTNSLILSFSDVSLSYLTSACIHLRVLPIRTITFLLFNHSSIPPSPHI